VIAVAGLAVATTTPVTAVAPVASMAFMAFVMRRGCAINLLEICKIVLIALFGEVLAVFGRIAE
jgi:hypothetical protein